MSEFQRPDGAAVQRVLVIPKTTGRCGSTWFCDLLNEHSGITCFGEVFNPDLSDRYAAVLERWQSGRRPEAVFDAIQEERPAESLVGFKLFREQVGDEVLRAFMEAAHHVVFIQRANLTAALVSALRAEQTKTWHAHNEADAEASRSAPALLVDVSRGRQRLRNALETEEALQHLAESVQPSIISVVYERLVANPLEEMHRVFAGLGLEPESVSSRFVKLNDDYSFVDNRDEVNRELGRDFGFLG